MLNISCVTGDLSVLIYFTETLVFCARWEESPWFKTVWLSVCVFRRGACDSSTCVHRLKVDAFMRSVEVGGVKLCPVLVVWLVDSIRHWSSDLWILNCSPCPVSNSFPQEQKEERADVWADGRGSKTQEGGMESSVPTLLRPKNCPPAGKPAECGPLPSHFRQPALTSHPPSGREGEDADDGAAAGFSHAAEGGLEGRIQEVVCSESSSPPGGAHAVCTPVPEQRAV